MIPKIDLVAKKLVTWIDNLQLQDLNDVKLKYSKCKKMNCDRLVGKAKIKFLKDLIAKLDIDEETFAPINWMNQKKCDLRYYMTQQQQIGIKLIWKKVRRKVYYFHIYCIVLPIFHSINTKMGIYKRQFYLLMSWSF